MRISIELQKESVPLVQAMAKEAGIGMRDMCEIAVYNLVALWCRERDLQGSVVPDDGLAGRR